MALTIPTIFPQLILLSTWGAIRVYFWKRYKIVQPVATQC